MRIVVIGAGVGGLAVAARLAARGHDVTCFEQSAEIGGKLGWETFAGSGFDTGPSLFTLPDTLRDTFESTGGWPTGLELQPLSPVSRIRFADGTGFDVHADPEQFHAELEAWSPGSGDDWRTLFARAERMWRATRGTFLERELHGRRSLARLALRRPLDLPLIAPWESLAGVGSRFLREPRLQQFLWRYATYSGSDPRKAPAALATVPYAEQHFGGWYVPGGLHRIGTALAARAVERGATIRTGVAVERVLLEGGRAAGVLLADGSRIGADVVVSGADAAHLYAELVPDAAADSAREQLARTTPSYSGLVLMLAVRGPRLAHLAHHTVLFPRNYTAEFDDLAAGRPVADPAIYLSVPDDPAVAGAGTYPWFVLVNAPRQGPHDWHGIDRDAVAARILQTMATRGYDIRDRVEQWRLRTPADLEVRTRSVGGAIYGSSANGARSAFLRPANRSPVPGLFLVGGSAHPGGGLPLVLLSAQITDRLIGS
jgi:phytoene desaturase